jgi:PKD repeat protein
MKKIIHFSGFVAVIGLLFLTACQKDDKEPAPNASFTVSKTAAEIGESLSFTNQSTNATSYVWDFDDGATSTSENPTHSFTESGTYTVELTAKGAGGTSTATEDIIVADPQPLADFSMSKTSAQIGEEIIFTNNSLNATSYEWSFGDGSASTLENPTHTYLVAGGFQVLLRATGPGGEHTVSKNITITYPAPVAGFTMSHTTAETGTEITFTNTSVNATSYQWNFGDGGTSTATNPKHTYTAAGNYEITLEVTGLGGVDAYSKSITITETQENLILPGDRAGVFILGDNLGVHKAKIGSETAVHATALLSDGTWLHILLYDITGIGFGFITSSSTLYNSDVPFAIICMEAFNGITDKGIIIGNTFSQVTAAYGSPSRISSSTGTYYYDLLGIYFSPSSTDETRVGDMTIYMTSGKKSTKSPGIDDLEDLIRKGNFRAVSPSDIQ